jgi:hypothetical protein
MFLLIILQNLICIKKNEKFQYNKIIILYNSELFILFLIYLLNILSKILCIRNYYEKILLINIISKLYYKLI